MSAKYTLDELLVGAVWQAGTDDAFEWACARVHKLVDQTVREAQERAWDQGYRTACRNHGGFTSCATGDHGQHEINPFRPEWAVVIGRPDPSLVVGDWTGETARRVEREAEAYRDLRARLRSITCDFLRTREMWANSEAESAVARAVAYQHAAGRLTAALDAVEHAHNLKETR